MLPILCRDSSEVSKLALKVSRKVAVFEEACLYVKKFEWHRLCPFHGDVKYNFLFYIGIFQCIYDG